MMAHYQWRCWGWASEHFQFTLIIHFSFRCEIIFIKSSESAFHAENYRFWGRHFFILVLAPQNGVDDGDEVAFEWCTALKVMMMIMTRRTKAMQVLKTITRSVNEEQGSHEEVNWRKKTTNNKSRKTTQQSKLKAKAKLKSDGCITAVITLSR